MGNRQRSVQRPRLESGMGESLQGTEEGSVTDIQIHQPTGPCQPKSELKGNVVDVVETKEPAGKLDDRFLKRCTELVITNDNNLYSYFLALDQKLFNGDKIDAAKHNSNNNIQMTGFNLAREWNGACNESDEAKLDKLCSALEAINRQSDGPKFREYFANQR